MKAKFPESSAYHPPSKWERHYRKLQTLRGALLADHAGQLADVTEPLETGGIDNVDHATDEMDHSLTLGILSQEDDALFEVEMAIQRIEDGTYGICEETGEPIPEARLRVVPWTRYTKEALERMERKRAAIRPPVMSASSGEPSDSLASIEPGSRKSGQTLESRHQQDIANEAEFDITSDPAFKP